MGALLFVIHIYNDFCDLYFKDNGFYRIDEYSSLRTIK